MFLGEPKEFSAESGKGLQCKVWGRASCPVLSLLLTMPLCNPSALLSLSDSVGPSRVHQVDGRLVIIGTKSWMQEMKVTGMSAEALEAAGRLESQARTAVLVAVDLQVCAALHHRSQGSS